LVLNQPRNSSKLNTTDFRESLNNSQLGMNRAANQTFNINKRIAQIRHSAEGLHTLHSRQRADDGLSDFHLQLARALRPFCVNYNFTLSFQNELEEFICFEIGRLSSEECAEIEENDCPAVGGDLGEPILRARPIPASALCVLFQPRRY